MSLTLLSWGVWAILGRFGDNLVTPAQSQAISTIGLAPILATLLWMRPQGTSPNRRRGIILAFAAGAISSLGNIAYYTALASGKAATVVPLTALFPMVTILLAVPILGERITLVQFAGLLLSLGAILLFSPPGAAGPFSGWMVVALLPILLWGVTLLLQKLATDHVSAVESTIWFSVAFIPLALLIVWLDPIPKGLPLRTWAICAALGFTLELGNLMIMAALASGGKASIVAPLTGLYPAVSIPLAIIFLGESLTFRESAGIALALTAVVLLSLQPTKSTSQEPSSQAN